VLWVDDKPMNNAYEAQGLRRLLEVDEATSTTEALSVLRTGRYGLVISDIVREEAGVTNAHAGRDLLRAVRGLGITVPVIFYGGAGSTQRQHADLRAEGAADVVATHVELLAAVRRTTREVFEAAVRHRAGALLVDPAPTTDVDAVLAVPGQGLVALELANWLRQPKRTAVEQRGLRLTRLIQDGTVRAGWVVAPGPEIPDDLRDAAPTGVEVLTFDELDRRLPSA
jgi:DNA-binding response OmpR family regulator